MEQCTKRWLKQCSARECGTGEEEVGMLPYGVSNMGRLTLRADFFETVPNDGPSYLGHPQEAVGSTAQWSRVSRHSWQHHNQRPHAVRRRSGNVEQGSRLTDLVEKARLRIGLPWPAVHPHGMPWCRWQSAWSPS